MISSQQQTTILCFQESGIFARHSPESHDTMPHHSLRLAERLLKCFLQFGPLRQQIPHLRLHAEVATTVIPVRVVRLQLGRRSRHLGRMDTKLVRLQQNAQGQPIVMHRRDLPADILDGLNGLLRCAADMQLDGCAQTFCAMRQQLDAVLHGGVIRDAGVDEVFQCEDRHGVGRRVGSDVREASHVDKVLDLTDVERDHGRGEALVGETAFGQALVQLGLTSLEAQFDAATGSRLLALVTASAGLAAPGTDAAADSLFLPSCSGIILQHVEFEHFDVFRIGLRRCCRRECSKRRGGGGWQRKASRSHTLNAACRKTRDGCSRACARSRRQRCRRCELSAEVGQHCGIGKLVACLLLNARRQ
mmetsp:Transcript_24655/g.68708  ORF Transcript_24655/g.68708 Transcript_24655/m.68708 type:complete len:361 (+) Transcript_24655:50-1132(+)